MITCVKFKVDFMSELSGHKLFILDKVIEELEKVSEERGKDGISARIAMTLLEKNDVGVLEAGTETDVALLLYGRRGYAIATQDTKLKRKLRNRRVRLVYLKQKRYVKIEERYYD